MKAKKEISVAIIIGLIIALVVTGGVLRARSALKNVKMPTRDSLTRKSPQPQDKPATELFIELTTLDNSVVTEPKLTLTGKTLSGTYIAILGEKGEYLIVPSDLGVFSQEVALVKGANTIKITIYEEGGNKVEDTLNAVYTTAEL